MTVTNKLFDLNTGEEVSIIHTRNDLCPQTHVVEDVDGIRYYLTMDDATQVY